MAYERIDTRIEYCDALLRTFPVSLLLYAECKQLLLTSAMLHNTSNTQHYTNVAGKGDPGTSCAQTALS